MERSMDYPEVMVGGLRTARLSRRDMMTMMVAECAAARVNSGAVPKLIFTANGHSIALAATDAEFRKHLDYADMIHADGQPVVLASRWLTHTPVPERTATTDFFHDAAIAASAHGLSFYLLGATEDVNAACAKIMQQKYPGLRIAGTRNGYFTREQEAAICEEINASGADIVWVGLGVPLEQAFCVRNKARLRAGWLVTAGGCFNFVTGHYARAPQWMQNAGLEWLYRIWREPKRLWLRYALTNPIALMMMLTRTTALPVTR
jgi:N-acetylglucosaminyldiphosphoundecaprenol N-acetyl-beta-D-mannosaminyltransferase